MSSTYKKLQCIKLTSDFRDATKVVELKLKSPEPNQILVKNLFAGINATDINATAGRYLSDGKIPFDIGLEGVGVVQEVGEGVPFKVGQAVAYLGLDSQGFSEYLYTTSEQLIPIPEAKAEYIALLICGLTASIGLDTAGRIQKGDTVLITAAAGGTGHICVQWAKSKGCHVIGTCSSKEKVEFLKKLGCDRVINYKQESIDDVLKSEYPKGVDVIWETIGGKVFEMLFKHLAVKGRMVIIGGITGYKELGFPDVSIPKLPSQLVMKSISLNGFFLYHFFDHFSEYFKKLVVMMNAGELKIETDTGSKSSKGPFTGIERVVDAVEHLHAGKNIGKVFVSLQK